MPKRKSIELFAGAGGLGLGLINAGFDPQLLVEFDAKSCQTLAINFEERRAENRNPRISHSDVRAVDFTEYEGKIDLLSGGPPCQPFSLGGRHQAQSDARDMFPEAIRAIRQAKPKSFILENVKGLTRSTFANYFQYLQLQMQYPDVPPIVDEDWSEHLSRLENHHIAGSKSDLQYRVVARVVNAADYGVPQRRERIIFVGFREDLDIDWAFPVPTHSSDALLWRKHRTTAYREQYEIALGEEIGSDREKTAAMLITEKPTTCSWKTVRDTFADLPDPKLTHPEKFTNHTYQPGARAYPGHTGSPFDLPAKALKAGVHGVPGGENMIRYLSGEVRYFTVRESARLQTFPDSFRFESGWSESMRQLGNAVPVRLAEVVGKSVSRALDFAK